jgi:heme/copper-type cytochrome/quinol oxidase subunit 1
MKLSQHMALPLAWLVPIAVLLVFWSTQISEVILANADTDRSLHSTYYVVPSFEGMFRIILFSFGLAIVGYVVQKTINHAFGFTTIFFHVGLISVGFFLIYFPHVIYFFDTFSMPLRYIDYPEVYETMSRTSKAGYFLVCFGLVVPLVSMLMSKWKLV